MSRFSCAQKESVPPPLEPTSRPQDSTSAPLGLPTVLEASSIDEILKARKTVPINQDNLKMDTIVGPEHVVLTGHIDLADLPRIEGDSPLGPTTSRTLFDYGKLRSVRVRCAVASFYCLSVAFISLFLAWPALHAQGHGIVDLLIHVVHMSKHWCYNCQKTSDSLWACQPQGGQ
jgi:hypothetical protein